MSDLENSKKQLTPSQEIAVKKCIDWFRHGCQKQIFRLYGAAGTGKSFIVGEIINQLGISLEDVAFATPTGKAATVLMQRFNYPNISTLCHLIYVPYTKDELIVNTQNEMSVSSSTLFSLKPELQYDLIVLDEVSMVDKQTMLDLMSFGKPIIAIGDPYQLPPINDSALDPNGADALLTEIVRQAADNPIIKIATDIRNGILPKTGNYDNKVIVIERSKITPSMQMQMMLAADQVICGLNVTRRMLNKKIRRQLGFESKLPQMNDKVICKSNEPNIMITGNINLCNGMIGKCIADCEDAGENLVKMRFAADICNSMKYSLLTDSGVFNGNDFAYDSHWIAYKMRDGKYKAKKKVIDEMRIYDKALYSKLCTENRMIKSMSIGHSPITRFDFAYAISCHAAQGSEFDNVVVIDESYAFRANSLRWLYTAVTRAKKKLILLV